MIYVRVDKTTCAVAVIYRKTKKIGKQVDTALHLKNLSWYLNNE